MVKACLQPEPAKRLTALEILTLPFFDDIYEHLEGTELQQDYDAAYAAAAETKAPSARSLRTASSTYVGKRSKCGGTSFLPLPRPPSVEPHTRLGRSASAAVECCHEAWSSGSPDQEEDRDAVDESVEAPYGGPISPSRFHKLNRRAAVASSSKGSGVAPQHAMDMTSRGPGISRPVPERGGSSSNLRRATTLGDPFANEMSAAFAAAAGMPSKLRASVDLAAAAAAGRQQAGSTGARPRLDVCDDDEGLLAGRPRAVTDGNIALQLAPLSGKRALTVCICRGIILYLHGSSATKAVSSESMAWGQVVCF